MMAGAGCLYFCPKDSFLPAKLELGLKRKEKCPGFTHDMQMAHLARAAEWVGVWVLGSGVGWLS